MTPFLAYHATPRRHRESIGILGLIPGRPMRGRPFGVYVFNDNAPHPTFSRGRFSVWWSGGPYYREDIWQVAYIGPMLSDEYVENGWVLLEGVPPQCLSLITHITPDD